MIAVVNVAGMVWFGVAVASPFATLLVLAAVERPGRRR